MFNGSFDRVVDSGIAWVNFILGGAAKIVEYPEVLELFIDEIGARLYVTSFGITG